MLHRAVKCAGSDSCIVKLCEQTHTLAVIPPMQSGESHNEVLYSQSLFMRCPIRSAMTGEGVRCAGQVIRLTGESPEGAEMTGIL